MTETTIVTVVTVTMPTIFDAASEAKNLRDTSQMMQTGYHITENLICTLGYSTKLINFFN